MSRATNSSPIVISGISLKCPESDNIEEFASNLFQGVDMITDDGRRWTPGIYGLPTRTGKLKHIERFDAEAFGISEKEANVMDPMLRILLELSFEAIYDAGVNPSTIRGSKVGVFVGAGKSESRELLMSHPDSVNEFNLTGHSRGMFANGISKHFELIGPSLTTETACSSSLVALDRAVLAIRTGQCSSAIVGGANLLLKPQASLEFHRLNMLSMDGKCKAFDNSANGYVRSEAIVVIYIQTLEIALKSYATILNIKTNSDGYKEQGITYPSGDMQQQLLKETYSEINLDPVEVDYIEAHGTGTGIGDPQELNSIANYFCPTRNRPLLIGSVKSNMGHAEHASGLCSLAKVIVAICYGQIPPNLHYREPNVNIPALLDGRLKVVKKVYKWNGGIVGINSFGFGGSNVHLILKSTPVDQRQHQQSPQPQLQIKSDLMPLLVPFSGRSESSILETLEQLKLNPKESAPLLQNIHTNNIPSHAYRGFLLQSSAAAATSPTVVESFVQEVPVGVEKPQIWLIFSGMGSQWAGMGRSLLEFQQFRRSIEECMDILRPYKIDLWDALRSTDDSVLESTINSFVAIAAVQIGLIDLLSSIGIGTNSVHVHGIIGHSIGENVCAYADGCTTKEETLLVPYYAGLIFQQEARLLNAGTMASIGLSWEQTKAKCPPSIYLACHNSVDNVSVAGPLADIQEFVADLTREGIFAREIKVGQAFHSPYIGILQEKFDEILLNNDVLQNSGPLRERSSKWISTSFPESTWASNEAKHISSSYFAHNLVSPVLFKEALEKIPSNSLVIEIGPHCLLQPILKRALASTPSTIIGLSNKNAGNPAMHLLASIGKIYTSGHDVNFPMLYSTGKIKPTFLSPIIRWNHDKSFKVVKFEQDSKSAHLSMVKICLKSHRYLEGHRVNQTIIFPNMGYLVMVCNIFAKGMEIDPETVPVIFENVQFLKRVRLGSDEKDMTIFGVNILEGNGKFEVLHGKMIVATGVIRKAGSDYEQPFYRKNMVEDQKVKLDRLSLKKAEVYKKLNHFGYNMSGLFEGLETVDSQGGLAILNWSGNWTAYLECLLQFEMLCEFPRKSSMMLSNLRYAYLDQNELTNILQPSHDHDKTQPLTSTRIKTQNALIAPGVELRGLIFGKKLELELEFEVPPVTSLTSDLKSQLPEVPSIMKQPANSNSSEVCHVHYASVRVRFPNSNKPRSIEHLQQQLEMESFSGINSKNEPVMGLLFNENFSSKIVPDREYVWRIPLGWTFEDAATVPWPYANAYFALMLKGELKSKENVLIPSAGEFGQAAISIALEMKCRIYTTVSSDQEQAFLLTIFPELSKDRIITTGSNGLGFEYQILEATKGQGVNVVVNMQELTLYESIRCLAQHGRLLNIQHNPNTLALRNSFVGMALFLNNITFYGISLFGNDNDNDNLNMETKKQISKYMSAGIQSGTVKPIQSRNTFKLDKDQPEEFYKDQLIKRQTILKVK